MILEAQRKRLLRLKLKNRAVVRIVLVTGEDAVAVMVVGAISLARVHGW